MLLEFRVTNFRSFQDEQVLNLVALRDDSRLETNCLETGIPGLPHVVRSAAVYGANASGKSNLIMALAFFQKTVRDSASGMREGESFGYSPFHFAPGSVDEPSTFEVAFVEDGVRHQYGFSLNRERVLEEWLLVYRKSKPQEWFKRTWNSAADEDVYEFSSYLVGERKLWQKSTRSNALFLTTAVQLNSQMLRPIYHWIANNWIVFEMGRFSLSDTVDLLEAEDGKADLLSFLSEADLGIASAGVTRRSLSDDALAAKPAQLRELLRQLTTKPEEVTIELIHAAVADDGTRVLRSLPLSEESAGTRQILSLAAPILRVLKGGGMLIVDELDRSLHPLLARFLVQLFNRRGAQAQLIFTTHNTSLIDLKQLMRRDQVFFVEKGRNLASKIYPLSDFKVRKDDPVEKHYLQGRLGAIPIL